MSLQLKKYRVQLFQQKDAEEVYQLFCDSYLQKISGLIKEQIEKTRIKQAIKEFHQRSEALNTLRGKKIPMNFVAKIDNKIIACMFACDIRMLPIPKGSNTEAFAEFIKETKPNEIPYGEVIYEGIAALHKDYRKFGLLKRLHNVRDQLFMQFGYSRIYSMTILPHIVQMMKHLFRAEMFAKYQINSENSKKFTFYFMRRDLPYYPCL